MENGAPKAERLTIRSVLDRRRPDGLQLIDAEAWLSTLSESAYTDLRAATTGQRCGVPEIVCAECEWPVYSPDDKKRRRYFQHKKGYPETCCYSGEGRDPRQVDAEKFDGAQEGPRHRELKDWLYEIISFSKTATGIAKEWHIRLSDGTFARPDVFAENWLGAPIAFDIQLATTQMPTIIRREQFYERGGIRYVWITDSDQRQLLRRSFRDIYMRNDGQIFGVDEEVLRTSRDRKASVFRIHRLVPGLAKNGFRPEFRDRIFNIEEINWGWPGSRPQGKIKYDALIEWRCQEDAFICNQRMAFFHALSEGDRDEAARTWDLVREYVGGTPWTEIPCDPAETIIALGVLATLSTGKRCLQTRIDVRDEVHLVNTMLLEPKRRRIFGEIFEQLANATGRHNLLNRPTVREKLERAKAETMSIALAKGIGPVYDAFIPQGSFLRLLLDAE